MSFYVSRSEEDREHARLEEARAGMNPRMAGIMCIFQFARVYYGLLIASRPAIPWNLIAIVINTLRVGANMFFLRIEIGMKATGHGREVP